MPDIDTKAIPTPPPWGRVIPAFTIGGSFTGNPWRIGYGIPEHGFDPFFRRRVPDGPDAEAVFLNPFGQYPSTSVAGMTGMRWDQATVAAVTDAIHGGRVARSFVETLGGWLAYSPDRRATLHMGSFNEDPGRCFDPSGDGCQVPMSTTGDYYYILDCIRRNLDLALVSPEQMTVSMDSAGNDPEESWTRVIIDEIESRGARVLIEARPLAEHTWHEGRDVLYTHKFDTQVYGNEPEVVAEGDPPWKSRWLPDDRLGTHYVLFNGHGGETIRDIAAAALAGRNVLLGIRLNQKERSLLDAIGAKDRSALQAAYWELTMKEGE